MTLLLSMTLGRVVAGVFVPFGHVFEEELRYEYKRRVNLMKNSVLLQII